MATDDLNFDDIGLLVTALKAVDGIKYADTDPAAVNTPGVWVRFDGLGLGTMTHLEVKLTLHLVVATANDRARTEKALADLFNAAKPVVNDFGGPAGLVTPAGLQLPGSQAYLPCLQIPISLLTTN